MESVALEVQLRDTENTTADEIRAMGMIPGECYGAGKDNVSVQVEYQTFRKLYNTAGENTVVDLSIDGKTHKALIHTLHLGSLHGKILHVDFKFIDMNKPVDTNVPLVFVGESVAVKDMAGTLTKNMTELAVRCLPDDIPHEIEVNIEPLVDFNSAVHVSDLNVPANVEVMDEAERTVVGVAAPKEEEPEEDTAAEEAEAIAALAGEEGGEGEDSAEEGE
jgi:large subunit ribosomal protein L25